MRDCFVVSLFAMTLYFSRHCEEGFTETRRGSLRVLCRRLLRFARNDSIVVMRLLRCARNDTKYILAMTTGKQRAQ